MKSGQDWTLFSETSYNLANLKFSDNDAIWLTVKLRWIWLGPIGRWERQQNWRRWGANP